MCINTRIEKIIEFFELNKNSFSKEIGLRNNSTISQIVSGRKSKPSFDVLEAIILRFPEISALWLLTGKGEMIIENNYPLQKQEETVTPPQKDDILNTNYVQKKFDYNLLEKTIKKRGYSLSRLGVELGMSGQGFRDVISKKIMRVETLESISKILDVDMFLFFGDKSNTTCSKCKIKDKKIAKLTAKLCDTQEKYIEEMEKNRGDQTQKQTYG